MWVVVRQADTTELWMRLKNVDDVAEYGGIRQKHVRIRQIDVWAIPMKAQPIPLEYDSRAPPDDVDLVG